MSLLYKLNFLSPEENTRINVPLQTPMSSQFLHPPKDLPPLLFLIISIHYYTTTD